MKNMKCVQDLFSRGLNYCASIRTLWRQLRILNFALDIDFSTYPLPPLEGEAMIKRI